MTSPDKTCEYLNGQSLRLSEQFWTFLSVTVLINKLGIFEADTDTKASSTAIYKYNLRESYLQVPYIRPLKEWRARTTR